MLISDAVLIQMYFQITLHISYVHAAVNPLLFMALHRALRRAALQLCCGCCVHWSQFVLALTAAGETRVTPKRPWYCFYQDHVDPCPGSTHWLFLLGPVFVNTASTPEIFRFHNRPNLYTIVYWMIQSYIGSQRETSKCMTGRSNNRNWSWI